MSHQLGMGDGKRSMVITGACCVMALTILQTTTAQTAVQEWMVNTMTIEEAVRRLKKIRRFAPFFLDKELDEVIATLESITTCGHCKYLTVQDDGVNYCRLYKTAKPWDGFCEKGEKR